MRRSDNLSETCGIQSKAATIYSYCSSKNAVIWIKQTVFMVIRAAVRASLLGSFKLEWAVVCFSTKRSDSALNQASAVTGQTVSSHSALCTNTSLTSFNHVPRIKKLQTIDFTSEWLMICMEGLNAVNNQIFNLVLHKTHSDLIINDRIDMKNWSLFSGVKPQREKKTAHGPLHDILFYFFQ